MTLHDPKVSVRHMLDHAREAVEMVRGRSRADLDTDRKLNLALVRLVEVPGSPGSAHRPPPGTHGRPGTLLGRRVHRPHALVRPRADPIDVLSREVVYPAENGRSCKHAAGLAPHRGDRFHLVR